jgi:ferredoxin
MSQAIINFENEKSEGLVAIGTYLLDAAKRLGINLECDCHNEEVETKGSCAVIITRGKAFLSSPTKLELELLSAEARKNGERLACQTKIERSGEITIMSKEKKESDEDKKAVEEETKEEFKKQFEELPLEKKIANLMELEAIALNETFSFVLNSPYAAVGKVMDVLAGFGLKMEKEDQNAKRPDEHKEEVAEDNPQEEAKEQKKSTATEKKTTASKTAAAKKTTTKKKTTKRTSRRTTAKKKDDAN